MSTAVRNSRILWTRWGVDNVTVAGTTTTTVTFIQVRWWWLTLPVGLELATIFLLVGTMLQNRNTVTWKSSALAFIFHGAAPEEFEGEKLNKYCDIIRVPEEKRVFFKETLTATGQDW